MEVFGLTPKLYLGKNAIANLEKELKSQEFSDLFIVCSKHSFNSQVLQDTVQIIKKINYKYFIYEISENVVDSTEIYEAAELFKRQKSHLIIAIGGSVCIDFAKVLSIYVPNMSLHHSVWHYVNDPNVLKKLAYPIVTIPTNFATSSMSNALSIIYNTSMNLAQGVISFSSIPHVTICDYAYLKTLPIKQLKLSTYYLMLDSINAILNNNNENWMWTKNYNQANFNVILKNTFSLLHKDINNEDAWYNLFSVCFFNGTELNKLNSLFDFDFISIIQGINSILRVDYCWLSINVFWHYVQFKKEINSTFKSNLMQLNQVAFSKVEDDNIEYLQQICELVTKYDAQDYDYQNKIVQLNEHSIHKMIEHAIIQYQKNYLDVIDIDKNEYDKKLEQATKLFTKIIYAFCK